MKLYLVILLSVLFPSADAQDKSVTLSVESPDYLVVAKQAEVLIDSAEIFTFERIRSDSSLKFVQGDKLNLPGKHVYWLRVTLRSEHTKDVNYRISSEWWDYVRAYLVFPDSTVQTLTTGLIRKKSELNERDFATFTLPAGKEVKLYARLSSSGHFMRMTTVNVVLVNHANDLENQRYYLYLSAILVGIMIGFAFYNLSFAFSISDSSYIWYFVYLVAGAISLSGQLGSGTSHLTQFFLPEHPLLGLILKRFSDPAFFVCLIMFSRAFLETRHRSKFWDRALIVVIAVLLIHSIAWLSGFGWSNLPGLNIFIFFISTSTVLVAAVRMYRLDFHAARFFIAGIVILAISLFIRWFFQIGWGDLLSFLPDSRFFNFIKTSLVFAGTALGAIIFSMALADRQKVRLEKLVRERTNDLKTSLDTLKATQTQLIHSEKMASLGELTAGIAHEIQNPLNFVNNFSELNTELIGELEQELNRGNLTEIKNITIDIKENEQKINHHGKRADAIVKGMLQHSRNSSGIREPTDINALCDEYLRLSYHGLRAKDKSFNVTLNTSFDDRIGSIDIVPQDIGRVILNLLNNAFYAVSAKASDYAKASSDKSATAVSAKASATADDSYKPTVSISTKKFDKTVLISITDNGNGIPEEVLGKIFQPFFTTKPTGQGTGLGLSLSFDIIKAHGGELKVNTTEGQGAEFIIELPLKSNP